ncbi:type VII secretion target [Actinokineospora soli]|uniref:Type VII secretion target n=1 Tax=Actinokineospora soli TaxID=1048753 RepID=A0ABW2TLX0_9PSEU
MSGFNVDVEQVRAHAANVEAIQARFAAVKAASSHIAQDDQAYGLLCGWISGILEGKHVRQDDVIAFVEQNLVKVAAELRASAEEYTATEDGNALMIDGVY